MSSSISTAKSSSFDHLFAIADRIAQQLDDLMGLVEDQRRNLDMFAFFLQGEPYVLMNGVKMKKKRERDDVVEVEKADGLGGWERSSEKGRVKGNKRGRKSGGRV